MINVKEWIRMNRITLLFLSEWALYLIFELIMGKFKSWDVFLMNLLPFIFFYLIANFTKWLASKFEKTISIKVMSIWIVLLVMCDHVVKYIVKIFLGESSVISLISDWLFISKVLNEHGSFVTSRFDLNVNMLWIILINILVLFFMIQGYRFYRQRRRNSFWIDLTMILLLAGGISSLIDKIFFGGSLDFIGLKGLFVADLKDFYLTIGIGCMLVELFDDPEVGIMGESTKGDIQLLKEFLIFCCGLKKRKEEISE